MTVHIETFQPVHTQAFADLNRAWLVDNGLLADTDEAILADPIGRVVEPGGQIFLAIRDGHVVGTCAVIPWGPDAFEMAKLTVARSARGLGIGRQLVEACLGFVREHKGQRVVLLSNSRLTTAIQLYETLGFRHCPLPSDVKYVHADVHMEFVLSPDAA